MAEMKDEYIFVSPDGRVVGSFKYDGDMPAISVEIEDGVISAYNVGGSPAIAALHYKEAEFPGTIAYLRVGGQ